MKKPFCRGTLSTPTLPPTHSKLISGQASIMTDVDVLSSRMKSRLHLQTKTIGAERIKKAKDNNEDIAVLSMFLPNASAVEENRNFYCQLGDYCRLGDPRATKAGNLAGVYVN